MFSNINLTPEKIALCEKTISYNSLFYLVLDALKKKNKCISVVRMGDGEKTFIEKYLKEGEGVTYATFNRGVDKIGKNNKWEIDYGIKGIDKKELYDRLMYAGNECTYFAPCISGIYHESYYLYNYFNPRDLYIDFFYPDNWYKEMVKELVMTAGHVLYIHSNNKLADAIQKRLQTKLNVKVSYLFLNSWEQSNDIIEKASKIDAPLTFYSGGPSNKWLGPKIANGGKIPKIVIDIGHCINNDPFTFYYLQ